ncbi:hypothetical protein A9Q84_15005 [Halobacteriovorax marinus]|uniref:Uncharacterized protein n=1 Tax=Halobacteriovorax marinus TaxID=97084 RepID=A0A1Y5F5H0_9BACT|nr:hypothetical protein A9Q84_15005 [Halobacteriovorax marinus]
MKKFLLIFSLFLSTSILASVKTDYSVKLNYNEETEQCIVSKLYLNSDNIYPVGVFAKVYVKGAERQTSKLYSISNWGIISESFRGYARLHLELDLSSLKDFDQELCEKVSRIVVLH